MVHSRRRVTRWLPEELRLIPAGNHRPQRKIMHCRGRQLRDRLREADVKSCLFLIMFVLEFLPMGSARSAPYVIDGFTLDQSVRRHQNFSSYRCEPSAFTGITECSRTQQRNTSLGSGVFSSKIMHTGDGTAVY